MRAIDFLVMLILISCLLSNRIDLGALENSKIDEASGISSSKNNPDLVWMHNDSGDLAKVYGVGLDGTYLGAIRLKGAIARDWEDMCIGPGPEDDTDYLYIGDIGDNFSKFKKKRIHRFEEPIVNSNQDSPFNIKIKDFDTIVFTYPDGNRDAEALMVDPNTKDLYILSKRESSVSIYRLPYPQSTSKVIEAEKLGNFTVSPDKSYRRSDQITAADISRDGSKIIIKTYYDIIMLNNLNNSVASAFSSEQIKLDYTPVRGGEAVCWRWDQSGYYTISEQTDDSPVHLYFYPF